MPEPLGIPMKPGMRPTVGAPSSKMKVRFAPEHRHRIVCLYFIQCFFVCKEAHDRLRMTLAYDVNAPLIDRGDAVNPSHTIPCYNDPADVGDNK